MKIISVCGVVCLLGSTVAAHGQVIPGSGFASSGEVGNLVIMNAAATGTTLRRLVKLTGAPSTAVITGTSDTSGVVGIASANAGTFGAVTVTVTGVTLCQFDGATVAGHYVSISGTTAGDCHDAGATVPLSGQVVGRVLSTNVSAGVYYTDLFSAEIQGSFPGGGVASFLGRTGIVIPTSGDYSFAQISGAAAPAQLPNPTTSSLGGTQAILPVTHQFMTTISPSGVPALAQPAAGDVTGLAASATSDTTVATNITTGTLAAGRLPATVVQTNQSNTFSTGTQDASGASHTLPALKGSAAGKPGTCTVGELYFATDATAGQNLYECAATNAWTQQLNSGANGASAALDNLSSTNINSAFLFQSGSDVGSTLKPARNLFIYGSGTYGSTSVELSGAPTGARVLTLPDATDTIVGKATTDTLTNKTYDTAGAGNSFSINGVAATANTGTGAVARAVSPSFTTPALGAATAASVNKVVLTAPASSSTLTVADGKTLTANNSVTLSGTDGTTMTFPTTSASLFGSVTPQDVVDGLAFCTDSGSNDSYACSLSPAIGSYVTGVHYRFKANTVNTGAATVNLNALGAKTIKKVAGGIATDLADNDIRSGQWVDVVYDGTNMQMQSTLGNAPGGSGTVTTTGSTTSTALVTSAGGTVVQTPSATATLDSSGNLATPGTVTSGTVGSVVGNFALANATSGTVSFRAVTGALGSAVLSVPAATDTLIARATTDTLTNKTLGTLRGSVNTVSFSATPNFDFSLGPVQAITLTANVTSSTFSNLLTGEVVTFKVCQDGTGGRTLVWPAAVKGAMTIGSTASLCSVQTFVSSDGTNLWAVSTGAINQ